jgi:hypothetical protein
MRSKKCAHGKEDGQVDAKEAVPWEHSWENEASFKWTQTSRTLEQIDEIMFHLAIFTTGNGLGIIWMGGNMKKVDFLVDGTESRQGRGKGYHVPGT